MLTLDKINHFATLQGDRIAIAHDDHQLTWNQFRELTEHRVAYLIKRYGADLPRQACYVVNNRIDLFPWLAAFATLAIPVTGMDYTLPPPTLRIMMKTIEADFVLLSSTLLHIHGGLDIGQSFHFESITFDLDSPSMAVVDAIGAGERRPPDVSAHASTRPFRAIGFTSGTSGVPKAAVRGKSFDQRRFQYFAGRYGFDGNDRFMVGMPLYHAAGNGWARLFLSLGATLYLVDSGDPTTMARHLDLHAITATVLSPVLLANILDYRKQARLDAPKALKWVLVGGKNFTEVEKGRALSGLGHVIHEYYGTTESGVNTIAEPDDLRSHPKSVGRAYDGNQIAILAADGTTLEPGRVGTVAIASYMTMDDYLGGGAQFMTLADGQRYFLTPDQGYVDQSGRLFLLNRSGASGRSAYLYELENAIRELPCVQDVAMVSHDGPQGVFTQCIYSAKNGGDNPRLLERIRQVAAATSVFLQQCRQVASIPYSPSGKVRVDDLRKLAQAVC